MGDTRNFNATNKIFEVLKNIKGFDIAMNDPNTGKLIVRYNGDSFYLTLSPIYNSNDDEKDLSFSDVINSHTYAFKK